MELRLFDTVISYPNDVSSLNEIADEVNLKTKDNKYVFSHFEIDGEEIYEEYLEYLTENIERIEIIIVHFQAIKDLMLETIESLHNYLKNALFEVELLAEEFYQIANTSTWNKFHDLITGIEWINNVIIQIDLISEKPKSWSEYITVNDELNKIITQLSLGLELRDEILIADMLKYEMTPLFERIRILNSEILVQKKRLLN